MAAVAAGSVCVVHAPVRRRIPAWPFRGLADLRRYSGQDQTGTAAAPGGLSAVPVFGLGLEPFREDDGGTRRGAPAQGREEVLGPDQAALVDLVPRVPSQELDPGPEAGLVVAPGSSRVVRVVNALAADVAALGNAGSAFLHHFPGQAVLQRLAGLDPAAEQVPVPLAVHIAGAKDDHPGLGEADAVGLVGVRGLRPERGIEPGKGNPAVLLGGLLDRSRFRFCQAA
jgi:hypothetical protein